MRRSALHRAAVAAFLAASCAVGPNYQEPPVDTPPAFETSAPQYTSERVAPAWWEQFGDETLVRLVRDAIESNLDVKIALANLNLARAIRSETVLTLAPIVTANASMEKQRVSRAELQGAPSSKRGFTSWDLGFDALWEIDLFGRIRREVEADTASVDERQAVLDDTLVSVIGEVGRAYFELRGRQSELDVARRNADNQEQTYEFTRSLLEEGRGTELDTASAQSQLEATRALIPPLETSIEADIHRLSVLTGRLPSALTVDLEAPAPIPAAPAEIAVGDPASLLRRRPDIRAAERSLAAATADIGVATADLFPRVTFVGSLGVDAATVSGLFGAGSGTYSFGPRIQWAAFDLGRVYARIRQTDANAAGTLAAYESTVLGALEETEDALVSYRNLLRATQSLRASADASAKAAELARLRYRDGISTFLTQLDAERRMLEAQERLAQSETLVATQLVGVYKALGGAWEVTRTTP
jgi:outer membrane protein, multidrug efflux system